MALFVEVPITISLLLAVYPRGYDWTSAHHLNKFDGVIGIIAAISQDIVSFLSDEQGLYLRIVMHLTPSEKKVQGVAKAIHYDMYFGRETAPAPP